MTRNIILACRVDNLLTIMCFYIDLIQTEIEHHTLAVYILGLERL